MTKPISLDDKYTATEGRVFLTGTQALVRLPMTQMRRDRAGGLNTGAFVTGYRGSPLGAYDMELGRAKRHLGAHDVVFQPGLNEELAATAVWGTQQVPLSRGARKDGVVGLWYGKGPGVDRCGDVFKHANAAGTSPHGGVLALAGDDHACKSSTVPHQSDHAFMAALIPVLYPSSVQEFLEMGLLGIAMSRYSGCWVGMKFISDTVETTGVVDLSGEMRAFVRPDDFEMPAGGLSLRWPDPPLVQDERLQEDKGYAAIAFARANGVDQVTLDSPDARYGIVASGKAYEDVRQALRELEIGEAEARAIGLRLYKVRMPWPLEPEGIRHFSEGLEEVFVVEERREIIENQIKQQLFNWRADVRPRIVGKFDEADRRLLSHSAMLTVGETARMLARRLLALDFDESLKARITGKLDYLEERKRLSEGHSAPVARLPYYCSGCPHNTSTTVPEGSKAMAGIGCHYMVTWMDRDTDTFTQMGGEGVPWSAIQHFTDETHRFANLGDGTYFHSGLLAIRASVAAKTNITYKVLYNDAVAMTGGQTHDGALSPEIITHQLHGEGVAPIYLLSDRPDVYDPADLAPGVTVHHRDELDAISRAVREIPGTSAIVYEQTCAAEKRRRRKRGLMEDPKKRVFINPAVCEGCGDCSVQSNCVSVEPVETPMGRKRRINQSTCNKDYSCLKGFCPSFVTVLGGDLRKRAAQTADAAHLPAPTLPDIAERPWNIAVTGVGGTGVLTIGAILGMAAHLDGRAPMILDMAGLAQKGGAVISHVRIGAASEDVTSPRIVNGGADLLLAADDVVAASKEGATLCRPERTVAVVNTALTPVADFVHARDFDFQRAGVERTIRKAVGEGSHFHDFTKVAEAVAGDAIATNIMMLGFAWQAGLVPIGGDAIEEAIRLNGVAVKANLSAFAWGRLLAHDPQAVKALGAEPERPKPLSEMTLDEIVAHRTAHLTAYQDTALARRYTERVEYAVRLAEDRGLDDAVPRAVAISYAKLLAYKDEYETARLFTDTRFVEGLKAQFEGDTRVVFNLAPPLLPGRDANGRPRKRQFGPWTLTLFRLLARMKRLRGTPLDLFGYSAERDQERRDIADYEALMTRALAKLDAGNAGIVAQLLALPQDMRGFGPVKDAARDAVAKRREMLMRQLDAPPAEASCELPMAAE